MARPYLGNPKYTIEVLQKYHFVFQKRFGQNFLIDEHVLEKIIESSGITKDDFILEIGPGIGTMTQYLAEAAREVAAVEIDSSLIPILKDTLKDWDNVSVINNDILKTDIKKIADEKNGGKPVKVVANLPYYITTPIIMGLFESHVPIESITVMVQKEVADRMQVGPGTKDYGALSLAVQYYAEPYIVANVPPNCFMPRPKVGSAVICLTRHQNPPVTTLDEKLMLRRKLPGLLAVEKAYMDGEGQYWYNISGKQSLDMYCRVKEVDISFIEKLIMSICSEMEILEWNLIQTNCLMLDPELIFITNSNQEIIFTVYPGGSGTIETEFQQLMEFLLTKVDHKDTRAVKAAYGIYEKTLLDGYSITDIRDEIVRTRQNEGKKAAVEESGGNGMEKVWREENNQPVVPERKYEDHPDKKRKDETVKRDRKSVV